MGRKKYVARGKLLDFGFWQAGVLAAALAKDAAATLAWIEAQPAGSERERLLERALDEGKWWQTKGQSPSADAEMAIRLLRELPEDAQIRGANRLGRKRAEHGDLGDLNAWSQNSFAGPVRAEAIASAVGVAFKIDASRVDALLAGVAGADRDAALRGLATAMSDTTPANAATRALGIADASLRRETVDSVMTTWLKRDPEASRAWLQGAPNIPSAWKQAWVPNSPAPPLRR